MDRDCDYDHDCDYDQNYDCCKEAKITKELSDGKKKSQNLVTMRNTCVRYAFLAFHEGVR